MTKFILDYTKAKSLALTNDAFYYLLTGEEPLDEQNLTEATSIESEFSLGFYIQDDWQTLDKGLVQCTIIPYQEVQFDKAYPLTKYLDLAIKEISSEELEAYYHKHKTGEVEYLGKFKIRVNSYGHKYFYTGDQALSFEPGRASMFFLKHFS